MRVLRDPGFGCREWRCCAKERCWCHQAGRRAVSRCPYPHGTITFRRGLSENGGEKEADADKFCSAEAPSRCTQAGVDLIHEAKRLDTAGGIVLGTSIAAVVAGTVLYVTTAPRDRESQKTGFSWQSVLLPGTAGLVIRGRYQMALRGAMGLLPVGTAHVWIWVSLLLGACGVRDVTLDPHALDSEVGGTAHSSGAAGRSDQNLPSSGKAAGLEQTGGVTSGGTPSPGQSGGTLSPAVGGVAGSVPLGEGGTLDGAGGSDPKSGSPDTGTSGIAAGAGGKTGVQGGATSSGGAIVGAGGNVAPRGGANATAGSSAGTGSGAGLSGGTSAAGRAITAGVSGSTGALGGTAGSAGAPIAGPAVLGIPSGTFATWESGSSVLFSVSLSAKPTANVSVGFTSTDLTEGQVSPEWLTFTPSNWNVVQKVTVIGVSDLSLDGDIEYQVQLVVASADARYAALTPPPISMVNRDSDAAFHGLGDLAGGTATSGALDVSGDGNTVVGYGTDASGSQAVRWTPEQGLVPLANGTRAEGISANGTMIVGSVVDSTWPGGTAATIWRHGAPGERFHTLSSSVVICFSVAYAVTDSGIAVGNATQVGAYGTPLGYRWVGTSGTLLNMSIAYAVSADGLVAAGVQLQTPKTSIPVSAVRETTSLGYPVDATCITPQLGDCTSMARGMTSDGSVVVGETKAPPPYATTGAIYTGFVWTAGEKMLRLPDLPFGTEDGAAYDVNASATAGSNSVIVGSGTDDTGGRRAMVWINRYPRTLESVLGTAVVPTGWKLTVARAVSQNGRVIVGEGTNPAGEIEGWRAILPASALW